MKRLGVLLITVALIVGLVGCPAGPQYSLTISSTIGGSVTTPGEGTFTYGQGPAASLVATPDVGFRFVEWSGDVGTIADVRSRTTTIAINGDYSVTANFVAVRDLTVTSSAGGSVTAPGEGIFVYDLGAVVNLVAVADRGYRFVTWTGDVGMIANAKAAATTISINGDYSIAANFELQPTGAFLDDVVITQELSPARAIQALKEDALDVYAFGIRDASLYAEVLADPNLTSVSSLGTYLELTFNPVGPTFPVTGKLNPLSVPKIREAMHWLIDREYIAQELCNGMALPIYTCLNDSFADARERYPDLMAAVKAKYAHDPARAAAVITAEMGKLGAVFKDGRWTYNGQPVEIIGLIRTEDERKETGDYFSGLLEGLGFTVTRQYGRSVDLAPIWFAAEPDLGLWHFYTGGWISVVTYRDAGGDFGYSYTNLGGTYADSSVFMSPLWLAYVNDPEFYEAAETLRDSEYTSMEERRSLFEICVSKSMEDNVRMFLTSLKSPTPMRANVRVAADVAGGVSGWGFRAGANSAVWGASGSWTWAVTAHFVDDEGKPIVGGMLSVALRDALIDPWNPIAGSQWSYDTFAIRATTDRGLQPDPRDGLSWPGRIERADVHVKEGMPVEITHDWLTLQTVPEIIVPQDAWADWDASQQRFLTAAERFPGGTTALRKSVVYYPKDIFTVPLHDGSTLSMGDFILHAILRFDRAKEARSLSE